MDTMQFHPISEIFPSTPPAEFDALESDTLMATPNCPTYGHPNFSTLIGQIVYFWTVWCGRACGLPGMAISPWIFIKRLNGQAQRVRPKAPSRGAVGNCRIGASTDCPRARPVARTVVHGGRVPHKPAKLGCL